MTPIKRLLPARQPGCAVRAGRHSRRVVRRRPRRRGSTSSTTARSRAWTRSSSISLARSSRRPTSSTSSYLDRASARHADVRLGRRSRTALQGRRPTRDREKASCRRRSRCCRSSLRRATNHRTSRISRFPTTTRITRPTPTSCRRHLDRPKGRARFHVRGPKPTRSIVQAKEISTKTQGSEDEGPRQRGFRRLRGRHRRPRCRRRATRPATKCLWSSSPSAGR